MADYQDDVSELRLQLGLLARDIQQNTALFERLSHSIEKIQEVNTNLLRMIALHEEKHEQHERFQNTFQQDIKDLHSRITSADRDIEEMIERKEQKILDSIDSFHRDSQKKESDDVFSPMIEIGRHWKIIWAMIAAAFFVGYYSAKIHIFADAILK